MQCVSFLEQSNVLSYILNVKQPKSRWGGANIRCDLFFAKFWDSRTPNGLPPPPYETEKWGICV